MRVGENLYLLSGGRLLEIDPDTGLIRRRLSPRVGVTSPPVAYPPGLLLGTGDGRVLRFDLQTQLRRKLVSAVAAVSTRPVLDAHNVYVVGYKGKVLAVSGGEEEGLVLWEWRPREPSQLISGLSFADGRLYVGDNRGYVYCLTAGEGVVLWYYPTGGPISAAPDPVRGRLLVFPYKSEALCLGVGAEPTLLWSHPDAERLIATGERGVYLLTRDNSVAHVLLDTGEEEWRLRLPEHGGVTSDPSQPTFYVYMPSGAIMAVQELP